MYDLAILGGGPAGTAAGVYAARKRLQSVLIAEEFGGQSKVSLDVQNWIGTPSIPGAELAKSFEEHLGAYANDILDLKGGNHITSLAKSNDGFTVAAESGESYEARAVLVATGSRRRKLSAKGAEEFDGKGIVYCASCDAPIFKGMDVVVVGGGNAGFETASQLTEYAESITLLERNSEFNADPITVDRVVRHPKVHAVKNAEVIEVAGETMVKSVTYKDLESGEEVELPAGGVFVEIGQIPNTDFAKDVVETDQYGHITIDPKTQQTSQPGIWAAGDCTDVLYHQNNIAAGDAVRALEDIYVHLKTK